MDSDEEDLFASTHGQSSEEAAEAYSNPHETKEGEAAVAMDVDKDKVPYKRMRVESIGTETDNDADTEIVFALDSNVSSENLQKQFGFVEKLGEFLPSVAIKPAVLYDQESAKTLLVVNRNSAYPSERFESNPTRIDLALTKAAGNLSMNSNQHQLVILITAGRQLSHGENEPNLLLSAAKELDSSDVRVVAISVGLETDCKELGLIVKRPQFLFRLSSFAEMTPEVAEDIASRIKETLDIEMYTKIKLYSFSKPLAESSLWEKISLCSNVMEGAWYMLYDDPKKLGRQEKIKKLVRESIDNFHSTLVSENKISISLAVIGPLGVGKSFFLNFLLNWDLPDAQKVGNGPLPSAVGASQTPIPIYVKYRKNVQVVLHKQDSNGRPVVWFPEEELGSDTLARVNSLLVMKFQEAAILKGAKCVELQGPFPVFRYLEGRNFTSLGQLRLDIEVELVDMPGYGDDTGNQLINADLSKADVVLFFKSGHSERPVSSEDIAQIFRRHDELEFTSRPKLVQVVNDRNPLPCDFDCSKIKEDLSVAWSTFLSSTREDEARQGCYKDVREKLPKLSGEALLEKLSKESDVIYFHSGNLGVFHSLKKVINDHVQEVKMKQKIHPFIQTVHWVAKKLKARIGQSISANKRKGKPVELKPDEETSFEVCHLRNEASDLVAEFMEKENMTEQSDFKIVHCTLYANFLYSSETLSFLWNVLKDSMKIFTDRLIDYWHKMPGGSSDLSVLAEILCESRVQQFFANNSSAYLRPFLDKAKTQNPFQADQKNWLDADVVKRKRLCRKFLHTLLNNAEISLEKEPHVSESRKSSHFQLIKQLKKDVDSLFNFGSSGASRRDMLVMLYEKLKEVVIFCHSSIREVNPHPSLDVQTNVTLPEKMECSNDNHTIPLQSCHDKIIEEMTKLLQDSNTKGEVVVGKLETKLKMKHGDLELRQTHNMDMRLWAKALCAVLSDQHHLNVQPTPSVFSNPDCTKNQKRLINAGKRLFAHQKSYVACGIVKDQSVPMNEIHLRKSIQEQNCLEVLVSPVMSEKLVAIRENFKDPSYDLAPVFIPSIRPGPTLNNQGNYFLDEDPWGKYEDADETSEEKGDQAYAETTEEVKGQNLDLNIFLVVEPRHLQTFQSTINDLECPTTRKEKLTYVVLPQNGRGIGVTRAIIKSLADCLNLSLYWTIDDDIQFMYQFDSNDRRWHKCSISRGLLFGQRVFQTCLAKTLKALSDDDRVDFCEEVTNTSSWPPFAKKTKGRVKLLLMDGKSFAEVQKNPNLLHSPFQRISEDCKGDAAKEELMRACEREFVDNCRKRLFEDSVNRIAGVSIAHESTKRFDYMGKYPTADYMCSNQRYQVVLNNTHALKGRNFVTDDMIFLDEEFQVDDEDKRNTPHWGIRGSDKSFCHALDVSGVVGFQVIRIVHSHKKLLNVFGRVDRSYRRSMSPHRSENEDDDE